MKRGLHRSGIRKQIATFICRVADRERRRIVSSVPERGDGVLVVQSIGAVALFLPVVRGMARRERYMLSNLLMPIGFAALLSGNLTMVVSSWLIILFAL